MTSVSLPNSNVTTFPSFKSDVADGLSVNAESGVWFVFITGIILAIVTIIVSSMALYQNTNFQVDDPLDDTVVWTSVISVGVAAMGLLVSPWLVFRSTIIGTIYFLFLFLVLSLVVMSLLAIAQSQQTDATASFETAIFWVAIVFIILSVGAGIALGILIWDLTNKQKASSSVIKRKTVTKKTIVRQRRNNDNPMTSPVPTVAATPIPTVVGSGESNDDLTLSPDLDLSGEIMTTGDGVADVLVLSQEDIELLNST